MDGHSKRVRNIWYEVEERYCSISFLKPAANWSVIYDFLQHGQVTYHVTY